MPRPLLDRSPLPSRTGAAGALLALLAGWVAVGCNEPIPLLTITSPTNGTFTTASSINVTGHVANSVPTEIELTVNGVAVPVQTDGTFTYSAPVSQAAILNPLLFNLRKIGSNYRTRQRIMVIGGQAVADGQYSPSSLGMRINDAGLDQLQPAIQSLMNSSFDIQALILAANPIISGYCIARLPLVGCISRVDVRATSVTYSRPVGVDVDAVANFTNMAVVVDNIRVNYRISGGIGCTGHITAGTTYVNGVYDQIPAEQASRVDVNQKGDVSVRFTSFNNSYDSGICDAPLLGSIIDLVVGDVQPLVSSGLVTKMRDPDGVGPEDAPIAAAIQSTLEGLSIAGPIGTSLGVCFDAEFNNIEEDSAGLTYRLDSRVQSPPVPQIPGPDQRYTYNPPETFPTLGASSPVNHLPYGLGLSIGVGALNQLLKADVESSGLLQLDLTEFQGEPLTAGMLSLFLNGFSSLGPNYPLTFRVRPTLSPFITGQDGPGGEMSDLRVPNVVGTVVGLDGKGREIEYLRVAFDVRIGLLFAFDERTGSLVPTFGTVRPSDITVNVISYIGGAVNLAPASESALTFILPEILAAALPDLGYTLRSFPIPSLLGLRLRFVEIGKLNQGIGLFLNPTTF
jgi:hypothetical protein